MLFRLPEDVMEEEKKDFYTLFSGVVKYNPEKDIKKEDNSVKEDKEKRGSSNGERKKN